MLLNCAGVLVEMWKKQQIQPITTAVINAVVSVPGGVRLTTRSSEQLT